MTKEISVLFQSAIYVRVVVFNLQSDDAGGLVNSFFKKSGKKLVQIDWNIFLKRMHQDIDKKQQLTQIERVKLKKALSELRRGDYNYPYIALPQDVSKNPVNLLVQFIFDQLFALKELLITLQQESRGHAPPTIPIGVTKKKLQYILTLLESYPFTKADLKIRNNFGEGDTLLHFTSMLGSHCKKHVTVLLKKGASVFEKNNKGQIPLHCAVAIMPYLEIVSQLQNYAVNNILEEATPGCCPSLTGCFGLVPLLQEQLYQYQKLEDRNIVSDDILRRQQLAATDKDGKIPFHYLAECNKNWACTWDEMQVILKDLLGNRWINDEFLDIEDREGKTPRRSLRVQLEGQALYTRPFMKRTKTVPSVKPTHNIQKYPRLSSI
jgi:hypothetical protein